MDRIFKFPSVLLSIATVLALTSCGGGESGPSSLNVSLKYANTTASPWETTVLKANFTGLQGKAATCTSFGGTTISSSSIPPTRTVNGISFPDPQSALPSGIQLDPSSCDIKVDVYQPGEYDIRFIFQVDGYYSASGGTIGGVRLSVLGPRLNYNVAKTSSGEPTVEIGKSLTSAQSQPIISGYSPAVGDQVSYKAIALPKGLSLNPSDGQLQGVPLESGGPQALSVQMIVKRGSVTRAFNDETREIWIAGPSLNYSQPITLIASSPKAPILPVWKGLLATDVVQAYATELAPTCVRLTASGLVDTTKTLVVDPNTGALTPLGTAPGNYCSLITATIVRNGYQTVITSPAINIFIPS
jgi:Putative Ig domain